VAGGSSESNKTEEQREHERGAGLLRLWAGVLVAPLAFLSGLQANYTLAQKLCPGGPTSVLHLTTLLFLLLALAGGLIAWRNWARAGGKWPDESAERVVRNRLLAAVGVMISLLSALIIVAQWIPQFIFNPCMR
jgi:hypothetical protein